MFNTLLEELEKTDKTVDINKIAIVIADLEAADKQKLKDVFSKLKNLTQLIFNIAELTEEQINATVEFVNELLTPRSLILTLQDKQEAASIPRLTNILERMTTDLHVKEIDLSNLKLGHYSLTELNPLITTLSKSAFRGIHLGGNDLYLLKTDLVTLLKSLVANSELEALYLSENNIASLDSAELEQLHQLKYSKGPAVRFWLPNDPNCTKEFKEEKYSDEKKMFLARILLEQDLKNDATTARPHEPIPFSLTVTQYFELYSHILDVATEKNICQFNNWINRTDRGFSDEERTQLANKLVSRFPSERYIAKNLKLNVAAGYKLSEKNTLHYLNWILNHIAGYTDNCSKYWGIQISDLTLTKDTIDLVMTALKNSPDIHSLELTLCGVSDEMILYLASQMAALPQAKSQREFEIAHLKLNKQEDINKLRIFLASLPQDLNYILKIASADLGLASKDLIEQFLRLNLPEDIELKRNKLERLKQGLPTLLRKMPSKNIDVAENALYHLSDDVVSDLVELHNETQKDFNYSLSHIDWSDLSYEDQLHHARQEARFEMLHSNVSSRSFNQKLKSGDYFKLFSDFMLECPDKKYKVAYWIGSHLSDLSYDERLQLAKKKIGIKNNPTALTNTLIDPDNYAAFKLNVTDTLTLYFQSLQQDGIEAETSAFQDAIKNVIKHNRLDDRNLFDDLGSFGELEEKQDNNEIQSFLKMLLNVCQQHWPQLHFYDHILQRLNNYKIEEDYDVTKLANMITWFTWIVANLISHKVAIIDPDEKADVGFTALDRTLKEVINHADPVYRFKLGVDIIFVFNNPWSLSIFNRLLAKSTQRSVLPALQLAKIIFLNEDVFIQETLIEKGISILNQVGTSYGEGRYLRSFIKALKNLSDVTEISVSRKLDILLEVLSTKKIEALTKLIEKFVYSLGGATKPSEENALNMLINNVNDEFPQAIQEDIQHYLQEPVKLEKRAANALKRQWQAQTVSYQNNRMFEQQMHAWYLIQGLCELKLSVDLSLNGNLSHSIINALGKLFNLSSAQKEQYEAVLGNYPDQAAILTYYGKIQYLADANRLSMQELYTHFVQRILSPQSQDFYTERYNLQSTPHLTKIFKDNPLLLQNWRKGSSIELSAFMKSHTILQKTAEFSLELFINEKIFAHKHLPFAVPQLKMYMSLQIPAQCEKLKSSIKDSLIAKHSIIIEMSDPEEKDEYNKLRFQYFLMCVLEQPQMSDENKLKLLRKAASSLNALCYTSNEFANDLHRLINNIDSHVKQSKLAAQPKNPNYKNWKILDTDNFWYLFTCGNLPYSCQRIDGDPLLNQALMAYVMDGKNRMFAIVDETGKLVARSIARLMYDEKLKQPVIYMEAYYSEPEAAGLHATLQAYAAKRARELQVALVSNQNYIQSNAVIHYPNPLNSYGSVAPLEYVDAIHRRCRNGIFSISRSILIEDKVKKPTRRASQGSNAILSFFSKSKKQIAKDDITIKPSLYYRPKS